MKPAISYPHPGKILKENFIKKVPLSLTKAAPLLKISERNLWKIVNGYASITPRFALILEQAGFGTAEYWIDLQGKYALAVARQKYADLRVNKINKE